MDSGWIREVAVPLIAVATFAWAVYAARRGWRDAYGVRRVQFIRDYTDDFYAKEELPVLLFDIDYGRFSFAEDDLGGPREVHVDRLLDLFNILGLAVKEGVLSIADLNQTTIGYAARVVWENSDIQWYLAHIDSHDTKTGALAFAHFRELGVELSK